MVNIIAENPFGLTKANSLTDDQIDALWVDVRSDEADTTVLAAARPASRMPMIILGGKGSGKTHLLRYCSYPIQKIRFAQREVSLLEGLKEDRYLGIFIRCSGLNCSRFAGKKQSVEVWQEVFAYYLELWLTQHILTIAKELVEAAAIERDEEAQLADAIAGLFNKAPSDLVSISSLLAFVHSLLRDLDYQVDNATFTGQLIIDVRATRGRLIFGIPALLAKTIKPLAEVSFAYQLDEFENLTASQQQHVNTLLREHEAPATFKIGGRQFGIKTRKTFSDNEENLRDSEYDELRLDEEFRRNQHTYDELARKLAARRLSSATDEESEAKVEAADKLSSWFEAVDLDWRNPYFQTVSNGMEPQNREHFTRLSYQLSQYSGDEPTLAVKSDDDIQAIVSKLAVPNFPLLEKVNLLFFYQFWARRRNLVEAAEQIGQACAAFIAAPEQATSYSRKLGHFKFDLVAQLMRENGKKIPYGGIDAFVRMSEGLPRSFITLLKQTYDWSLLQREEPFVKGRISAEAQRRGAVSASEWFYNSMTKAGSDGPKILSAVDRLGHLFRIHRFSDKPIETSLIGFSVDELKMNEEARHVLNVAHERSFLVKVFGGQRDRNSSDPTTKYQINRMLSPRWDLPIARRGIHPFSAADANAIFEPGAEEAFEELARDWRTKLNAPFKPRVADPSRPSTPGGQLPQPKLL